MSEEKIVADAETARALETETRTHLEDAGIDPNTVLDKECSYRALLDAGVDESVAERLRRRFSLPWSFETDGDLGRRSDEVRGLDEAERAWIAASEDEEWQAFDGPSIQITIGREKPAERPWPRPTPVTAVAGVGPDDAETLAEGGITSAERLATINASEVADVLELDVRHVRMWRHSARTLLE
ncbi:DUF7409 domain-containing protein [Salinadaptatus halalkaliphilus]|uniref:DUF7409 domain-containing protein n=1 Tax=Salinadaptatus halalkaliphilus TaxID=2419781 RepID=UPI003741F25B